MSQSSKQVPIWTLIIDEAEQERAKAEGIDEYELYLIGNIYARDEDYHKYVLGERLK